MSIFEVGRMCIKIAGRDAGRRCIVVERVDDIFVVVDGETRRKKVNIKHLEPIAQTVEISDKASHEEVKKVFSELGLKVWEKKSKKPTERPKKQKVKKEKPVKKGKAVKKEAKVEKKETKPETKEAPKEEKPAAKPEVKKEEPKKEEKPAEEKPKQA
jgi:large subunit ribosomal protein L14e